MVVISVLRNPPFSAIGLGKSVDTTGSISNTTGVHTVSNLLAILPLEFGSRSAGHG